MVRTIDIFARYGEYLVIADEIDQRSVQIISRAGELAIDLAGKEFIAIDWEIEVVRILAV